MGKILIVSVSLVIFRSAVAQEKDARNGPWFGFDVGSWVIVHETGTRGEKVDNKTKIAVSKYRDDDGSPEMTWYIEVKGKFEKRFEEFRLPGLVAERKHHVGSEKQILVLGGKKIPCKLEEYAWDDPKRTPKVKLKLWRADGVSVPYRDLDGYFALGKDVVKATVLLESKEARREAHAEVVSWAETIQIGKRTLSCIREKKAEKLTDNGVVIVDEKGEQWLSDEVPGRSVKVIRKGKNFGRVVDIERTVLDFYSKKRN